MNGTAIICTGIATLGLLGSAALLTAGPLNPPAGAVSSTFKTLSEVEPRIAISAANTTGDADSVYRISQPGSYYLSGNVAGATGKYGIEIAASDVTIDLNGFEVVGTHGSRVGIAVTSDGLSGIVILNGNVRRWGEHGIDMVTRNPSRCTIKGVRADFNLGKGIYVGGYAQVEDCTVVQNLGSGIEAVSNGTVIRCIALNNGESGITAYGFCLIEDCTSQLNAAAGIAALGSTRVVGCTSYNNSAEGYKLGAESSAAGCSAIRNDTDGFNATSATTLVNCSATRNTTGIRVGSRSSIIGCNVSDNNGVGILTAEACTITDCNAVENIGAGILAGFSSTVTGCNVSENSGAGLTATDGCNVSNCTASNNGGIGLALNNGCRISGCMTRNNQLDGIFVNFSCEITQNNCNGDGVGAGNQGGIRVAGQANRIDSNNVTYADRGVMVDQGGNIIVRNTAKGCAVNYSIVAGNSDAQILGVGTGFNATNPWANFSY